MPNAPEIWGFHIGEQVQIRKYRETTWEDAKVMRFDADRNIWATRVSDGRSQKIANPKLIRKYQVPSTPEEILKWLEA